VHRDAFRSCGRPVALHAALLQCRRAALAARHRKVLLERATLATAATGRATPTGLVGAARAPRCFSILRQAGRAARSAPTVPSCGRSRASSRGSVGASNARDRSDRSRDPDRPCGSGACAAMLFGLAAGRSRCTQRSYSAVVRPRPRGIARFCRSEHRSRPQRPVARPRQALWERRVRRDAFRPCGRPVALHAALLQCRRAAQAARHREIL